MKPVRFVPTYLLTCALGGFSQAVVFPQTAFAATDPGSLHAAAKRDGQHDFDSIHRDEAIPELGAF
jgi:hypothetical protein